MIPCQLISPSCDVMSLLQIMFLLLHVEKLRRGEYMHGKNYHEYGRSTEENSTVSCFYSCISVTKLSRDNRVLIRSAPTHYESSKWTPRFELVA